MCHAIEHNVKPDHGKRVADDYFGGAPPFSSVKHRPDIPDSFIWQTVRDLAKEHGTLHVVVADGALLKAASDNKNMAAHESLEAFIETPHCQTMLKELAKEAVTANVGRVSDLLAREKSGLARMVETDIVNALHGRTVYDDSIPDDNNEGMIFSVYSPHELTFDFANLEYYGAGDIGIPFEALVECELNYAIFKADYFVLSDERTKTISIGERNEHYFDADEDYVIKAEGILSLQLDTKRLENEDIEDSEMKELIGAADHDVEITETAVSDSGHAEA